MNIQDIMRGLPFPVQGLLMQAYGMTGNQQPQQNAGAGRGFVNPPLVNPNAAPPQMPRVQPSRPVGVPKDEAGFEDVIARIMAGGSTDELQNAPAVEATPVQAAMQPDLPAPAAQETAAATEPTPMQEASGAGSGILGYLDKAVGFSEPGFVGRLGTALAVAGSQDPTKALMQVQQNRAEDAKIAEARRRANQPKIEPITGTPFFQITHPDGRMETVNNPALAKFYQDQSAGKAANKRTDMELQAELNAKALDNKAGVTAANAAIPEIKSANALLESIKTGRETLSRMGTADQIKGLAGGAGDIVAGFAAPQMNIDSQRREAVRVLDWVNSSAGLKGALSNVEGLKLDMPLPKPTASKEEWQAYFDNAEKIVNSALTHFQTQAARSPAAASSVGVSATPAPAAASGGVSAPTSKADFDKLPSGTRFRAPDGSIRIKP